MTTPLDELITPLTREQVQANIYAALAANGVNTTSWKPGAVTRALVAGCSVVLAGLSALQAEIARAGYVELAEKKWLTVVARYVYGIQRIDATFASGVVILTNTGGGVFELDANDLVVRNPTNGATYRNTSPVSLGAAGSPTDVVTVPVQAIEAGSTVSLPNTITAFTTPLNGVSCTNPAALVGLDAETDPALRSRCSEMLGALSPMGPPDAYAAAVRNARNASGAHLGVTRIRPVKDGYGNLGIYLATAAGEVPGTVGDITTDLGVADAAIQQWAAPLVVTAFTFSATAVPIAVTYELWLYNTSSRTEDEVKALIEARLARFFQAQPIGGNVIGGGSGPGKVFADAIRVAIGAALPEIFHAVVTLPASDTTLAISEVPTLGVTTMTAMHTSPPPEGLTVV